MPQNSWRATVSSHFCCHPTSREWLSEGHLAWFVIDARSDGPVALYAAQPDFEVVAEAADGAQALELAGARAVDQAVLDVAMPRMTGLQAAGELSRRHPEMRLLMLSMYDDEQYRYEALKAGASGYVLKSAADRDLLEACSAAMRGEPSLYPAAVSALIADFLARARAGEDRRWSRSLRVILRWSS